MDAINFNSNRAAMAQTPEDSDYTTIQARIENKDSWLLGFGDEDIPYYLTDYIFKLLSRKFVT